MSIVTGSIQVAYRTEAEWTAWDGIPLPGQICYSNDVFYGTTNCPKFKVGNGVDIWSAIDYHPDTTGANVPDGDYGDITVSGGGTVWTIDTQSVTFAKMQHIATQKLLGRHAAGTGDIQEIGLDGGVEFQGGNLKAKVANSVEISSQNIQLKNDAAAPGNSYYYGTDGGGTKGFHALPTDTGITQLTGDITAGPGNGSQAATIANDAVTFAKMQNIATDKLLGRDTALSGNVEEIGLNATLEFDGAGNIQRAALTGDITATAGSNATTLATVNSNVGSFTNASITVNAKGLITAASSGTSAAQDCIVLDSFVSNISASSANYFIQHRSVAIAANTIAAGDIIEVVAGLYKSVSSGDTAYYIYLSSTNVINTGSASDPYSSITDKWGLLQQFGVVAFAQATKISYSWNTGGLQYTNPAGNGYDPYQSGAAAGTGSSGPGYNGTLNFAQQLYINWVTYSTNNTRVRGYDYGIAKLYKQ